MAVVSLVARISAQSAEFEKTFSKASQTASQFEKQYGALASSVTAHQARINKAFESFSGDKVIREANEFASAIDRVGGASKLTASEQGRVNATVTEAIAKYKALGNEAPASLRALEQATRKVEEATAPIPSRLGSILRAVGPLAGALGIGFSVGAVVNFGKSVFDSASQIHDMAEQLGISAEAAQGFKFAAEQSGSSIEAVGTAVTKMNQHLAGGEKSTIQALRDAGLGFDAIRAMKPEDAFLAITDAIQHIPDPMTQARVALELFGKGAAELLPGIKEGFRGVSDAASKMSTETVNSLEHAQDVWEKFGNAVTIQSAKVISGTFDALNVWKKMTDDLDRVGLRAVEAAKAPLPPLFGPAGIAQVQSLDQALARLDDGFDAQRATLKKASDEAEKFAEKQKELNARFVDAQRALVTLTDAQAIQITQYLALKISVADIAAKMHLGTREVQAWATSVEAMNKVTAQSIPLINRWKESLSHSADNIVPMIQVISRAWPDAITGLDAFSTRTKTEITAMESAAKKAAAGIKASYVPLGQEISASFESALSRIPQLLEQAFTGGGGILGAIKALGVAMADAIVSPIIAGLSKVQKAALAVGTSAATVLGGAVAGGTGAQVAGLAGTLAGAAGAAGLFGDGVAGSAVALGALTFGVGAAAVGVAVLVKHLTDSKGRNAVRNFAESFGGFDQLHSKLLEVGSEGERLWITLTQGVGRNNATQAAAAIDAVNAALARQKDAQTEAGAAATAASLEQQAATDAVMARIADLGAEFSKLNDSVKNEAPEEVMGVIESLARARMDAITEEQRALQSKADEDVKVQTEAQKRIENETQDAHQRIQDFYNENELEIPYHFKATNAIDPGGSNVPGLARGGIVRRPTLALVGERGPEAVIPLSQLGRGGNQAMRIQLVMPNGQVLLEQMVKAKKDLGL